MPINSLPDQAGLSRGGWRGGGQMGRQVIHLVLLGRLSINRRSGSVPLGPAPAPGRSRPSEASAAATARRNGSLCCSAWRRFPGRDDDIDQDPAGVGTGKTASLHLTQPGTQPAMGSGWPPARCCEQASPAHAASLQTKGNCGRNCSPFAQGRTACLYMAAVDMLVADGVRSSKGRHGPASPARSLRLDMSPVATRRLSRSWAASCQGPPPEKRDLIASPPGRGHRRPACDRHRHHKAKPIWALNASTAGVMAPGGACRNPHWMRRPHRARNGVTGVGPGARNTQRQQAVADPQQRMRNDFAALQTASRHRLSSNAVL